MTMMGTTSAFWQHYRRTFGFIQLCVFCIAAALFFYFHVPLPALAFYVLVMEIFSVIGSLWGVRLRRKVQDARDANVKLH